MRLCEYLTANEKAYFSYAQKTDYVDLDGKLIKTWEHKGDIEFIGLNKQTFKFRPRKNGREYITVSYGTKNAEMVRGHFVK